MHIDLFVFVFVFVFALWLSWHIINAQLKTFTWPRNATTLHNNTTALPGCLCVTLVARLPDRLGKRERQSGRAGERKRATEQLGRHFKIVKLTHRQAHTHTHKHRQMQTHTHTLTNTSLGFVCNRNSLTHRQRQRRQNGNTKRTTQKQRLERQQSR